MGEVAEMMYDGTLCQECGSVLESDPMDFPVLCHDCHGEYKKRCDQPYNGMYCERFYAGVGGQQ